MAGHASTWEVYVPKDERRLSRRPDDGRSSSPSPSRPGPPPRQALPIPPSILATGMSGDDIRPAVRQSTRPSTALRHQPTASASSQRSAGHAPNAQYDDHFDQPAWAQRPPREAPPFIASRVPPGLMADEEPPRRSIERVRDTMATSARPERERSPRSRREDEPFTRGSDERLGKRRSQPEMRGPMHAELARPAMHGASDSPTRRSSPSPSGSRPPSSELRINGPRAPGQSPRRSVDIPRTTESRISPSSSRQSRPASGDSRVSRSHLPADPERGEQRRERAESPRSQPVRPSRSASGDMRAPRSHPLAEMDHRAQQHAIQEHMLHQPILQHGQPVPPRHLAANATRIPQASTSSQSLPLRAPAPSSGPSRGAAPSAQASTSRLEASAPRAASSPAVMNFASLSSYAPPPPSKFDGVRLADIEGPSAIAYVRRACPCMR